MLLLIAGVRRWLVYLSSPQRVARQFLAAIERKDVDGVYALTMEKEKREMGVTKEVISRVLHDILYRRVSHIKVIPTPLTEFDGPRADNWYRLQHVTWGDASTDKPLPSKSENGMLRISVDLFRSPEGRWEVSFTCLASSYIIKNITKPMLEKPTVQNVLMLRRYRRALLQQWGIKTDLPEPAIVIDKGHRIALLGTKAYDPLSRYEEGGRRP